MSSLAAKLNYEPINYKNLSKIQSSTNIAEEMYTSLPPPRPVNCSTYDCPPSPQEVPLEKLSADIQKHMHISTQSSHLTPSVAEANTSLPDLPPPPPPPPPYSCQMSELPPPLPPPFPPNSGEMQPPAMATVAAAAAVEQPHRERQDWRYLEMRVAQGYQDSTSYGKAVSIINFTQVFIITKSTIKQVS